MSEVRPNASEVARVLKEIDDRYVSSYVAMHGPVQGCAMHTFIIQRMERIANCIVTLHPAIGDEIAVGAYDIWHAATIAGMQQDNITQQQVQSTE